MKHAFKNMRLSPEKRHVILTANRIIEEYARAGYDMTLRQVYYQMVARDLFPESWFDPILQTINTQKNYKKLGTYIDDGRMTGMIDWDHIVDRTRTLQSLMHWDGAADRIKSAYETFRIDKWENQPVRIEAWVEKEALEGVLRRVCQRNDISFFCCRGYSSQSAMYEAAQRLAYYMDAGQDVTILHLGDHDPSGIDMTRDIQDRLIMFLEGMGVTVDRLALNWEQVQLYNPPPNFAKQTDSRFAGYEAEFGEESWELDALPPDVIDGMIQNAILNIRDDDLWEEAVEREKEQRRKLAQTYMNWDDVSSFLDKADEEE